MFSNRVMLIFLVKLSSGADILLIIPFVAFLTVLTVEHPVISVKKITQNNNRTIGRTLGATISIFWNIMLSFRTLR